jgi:hypothetical protein
MVKSRRIRCLSWTPWSHRRSLQRQHNNPGIAFEQGWHTMQQSQSLDFMQRTNLVSKGDPCAVSQSNEGREGDFLRLLHRYFISRDEAY